MQLCAINKCVTTILNKERKKSWTEKDRDVALFTISLLREWLDADEIEFKNREFTDNEKNKLE